MFNPNDEKYDGNGPGNGREQCATEGWKLFAAVGHERFVSTNRNPCIDVRCVCLASDDGNDSEVGRDASTMFTMTNAAAWRFAKLCRALGIRESFDETDDNDLHKVITTAYFRGRVKLDTVPGKQGKPARTYAKIEEFEPAGDVSEGPDDADIISEAEEAFEGYVEWRSKNPRGQGGGGNRGGGSGGGGGGDRPGPPDSAYDKGIPF